MKFPQSALVKKSSTSLHSALTAYALAGTAVKVLHNHYTNTRNEALYTVTVGNTDSVYSPVQAWLTANIPSTRKKSLRAKTSSRHEMPGSDNGGLNSPAIAFEYDGSRNQTVFIKGNEVRISVEERELKLIGVSVRVDDTSVIRFTAKNVKGRDAVIEFLKEIAEKTRRSGPKLHVAREWGDWNSRNDLPLRSMDTVVLRKGQKEEIINDLQDFLDAEDTYNRLGVPYHRGYLLHGPSGSGKSSLARALATQFNLDLYYLPLSDISKDTKLHDFFGTIQPGSILLLEDIDVVHAAKVRDDSEPGISLSGLLNALDGIGTPHAVIVIMTTNNISVIDKALIRPGRADRVLELDYLDDDQFQRLVQTMVGATVDVPLLGNGRVSSADVVGVLKSLIGDTLGIEVALEELVKNSQ